MSGWTIDENVDERQYDPKLMISRTSTPASAGRSRRPSRRRRGVPIASVAIYAPPRR